MYDFLILYEGKVRELESICLLAAELENRGYKVKIINTFLYQVKRIKRINAKIVITPFLYTNSDINDYVLKICQNFHFIINLRWEQIFSVKNETDFNSWGYPKDEAKNVIHICWSEYLRNLLIHCGVDPENAVVTGSIQMDFFREELSKFYLDKKNLFFKYNLDERMKVYLFISSFSYATLSRKELKTNISKECREMSALQKKSRSIILSWIEKRLKNFADEIWIYRPHPSERESNEVNCLEKKYSNFKVIKDESVRQWIMHVDKIFNWYSTSFVDTYFAKKENYILRPVPLISDNECVIMKGLDYIDNIKDFNNIFKENVKISSYSSNIKKYYNQDKYLPSYKKIANLCEYTLHKNDCLDLDIKKIKKCRNIKQKIKDSSFYYLYTTVLLSLLQIKCLRRNFLFHSKYKLFYNNLQNIVSDDDIKKIIAEMKKYI